MGYSRKTTALESRYQSFTSWIILGRWLFLSRLQFHLFYNVYVFLFLNLKQWNFLKSLYYRIFLVCFSCQMESHFQVSYPECVRYNLACSYDTYVCNTMSRFCSVYFIIIIYNFIISRDLLIEYTFNFQILMQLEHHTLAHPGVLLFVFCQ